MSQSERDKLDLLFKKALNYQFIDSDLKPAQEKVVNYYINNESIFSDSIPEKSIALQFGSKINDTNSGLDYQEVTTTEFTHLRRYVEMTLVNEENNRTSTTGGSWLPSSDDISYQNYMREILFPKFIFNINGNMSPIITIDDISINLNNTSYLPFINGGVLIFLGNPNGIITTGSNIKLKNFFIYNGRFGTSSINTTLNNTSQTSYKGFITVNGSFLGGIVFPNANTPYVHRCLTLSTNTLTHVFDDNAYYTNGKLFRYIPKWNFDINGSNFGNNGSINGYYGIDHVSDERQHDLFITYSDVLGGNYYNVGGHQMNEFISGVYIRSRDSTNNLNFTGQHRCFLEKYISSKKLYIGLIVNSSGKFININSSLKPNINEALPICKLCSRDNAKNVFGVISDKEDKKREYFTGNIGHNGSKIFNNEYRFMINSLGEGGIWVSNKNGILENGDYITSSNIPGYGQKQLLNEGLLSNFTVAKITCDCNFNLNKVKKQKILTKYVEFFDNSNNKFIEKQIDFYDDDYNLQFEDDLDASGNPIYEYIYDTRFLDSSANILSGEEEYLTRLNNGENVYIACFVGCTYHCG